MANMLLENKFTVTGDWDSHLKLLWEIISSTPYNIFIEVGSGFYSTPALKEHHEASGVKFISYETNPEWKENFPDTILVDEYMNLDIPEECILFIDCAPGEIRAPLAEKYADIAKIIIIHDTQPSAEYVYHMSPTIRKFKYYIDDKPEGLPWTTAVSNFMSLANIS
jgi:hypothetical protein